MPPSTLGEHIYGVSLILTKGIFQISPGWLPLLLMFWFTYLYHRYSGEAFSHSLKEAIEDGKKHKYDTTAICSGHCVWRIVFIITVFIVKHVSPILTLLSEYKRNLYHSAGFTCVSRVIVLSFLLFHCVLFLLKLSAQFLWYMRLSLRPISQIR